MIVSGLDENDKRYEDILAMLNFMVRLSLVDQGEDGQETCLASKVSRAMSNDSVNEPVWFENQSL
jgi:hypothetical protein